MAKKKVKRAEKELVVTFTDRDDFYGDSGWVQCKLVKKVKEEEKLPQNSGGWKKPKAQHLDYGYNRHLDQIWYAEFMTEANCCGFPVMGQFQESGEAKPHVATISEKLREYLKANVIYMAAYVPDTTEYKWTRKILEAAGFIPHIRLTSTHEGSYTNTRWQWFDGDASQLLVKGTNEKTIPTTVV
jgi:hypothetical protein